MAAKRFVKASVAMAATGAAAAAGAPAVDTQVSNLIGGVKNADDTVRGQAWLNAWKVGAPAVKPLADVMAEKDTETMRAAKRALWTIVRHVGRPGADQDRMAIVQALIPLVGEERPDQVRREMMWMLSEIGGDETVEPIAGLLKNEALREDARMVLERLPGDKSLAALKAGLDAAPEEFKQNIAQSLRMRGQAPQGIPDKKMVPTKQTTVKPA